MYAVIQFRKTSLIGCAFRNHLTQAETPMKLRSFASAVLFSIYLVGCGGGGSNNATFQGSSDGNTKLQVANNLGQSIASATVIALKANDTLYNGQFTCAVNQNCTLGITTNAAGYEIKFFNAEGDLIGAWITEDAQSGYVQVNASISNLGAYVARQLTVLNNGDATSTLNSTSNYLTVAKQTTYFNMFEELGQLHNQFTAPGGQQSSADFHSQLYGNVKNTTAQYSGSSSSMSVMSALKPMFLAAVAPTTTPLPAPNCTGAATPYVQKLSGVVSLFSSNIPIPGIGVFASALNKILGDGCDNTNNQLKSVLSQLNNIGTELSDMKNTLSSLQLGQQSILQSISNLQSDLTDQNKIAAFNNAKTAIYNSSVNVQNAVNAVSSDVTAYAAVLNSTTPASQNLGEFFEKTGGLNASSMQNPKQNAAIQMLNSLSAQKSHLDALGVAELYQGLADSLNQICSNSTGLQNAVGDFLSTRRLCNGILANIIPKVYVLQSQATLMLKDQLNVLEANKGTITFPNPFGTNLTDDLAAVDLVATKSLNGIANILPQGFSEFDGIPTTILNAMKDPALNCSANVDGNIVPAVAGWYPNTRNSNGVYIVTNCLSPGDGQKYAMYYTKYGPPVMNIMGVLSDTKVSYPAYPIENVINAGFMVQSLNIWPVRFAGVSSGVDAFKVSQGYSVLGNSSATLCGGAVSCGSYGNTYPTGNYIFPKAGGGQFLVSTNYGISNALPAWGRVDYLPSNPNYNQGVVALTDAVTDEFGRNYTYVFVLQSEAYSIYTEAYEYNSCAPFGACLTQVPASTYYGRNYYPYCITKDCSAVISEYRNVPPSLSFVGGARSSTKGPSVTFGLNGPELTIQ